MMFTITALILSISPVFGDLHRDPEYCNNETLKLTNINIDPILPKNFIVSPNLKCISITYGRIRFIQEGTFENISNLMYLNLEYNSIPPEYLFSFGELPKLRALILGNQVKQSGSAMVVKTVYPELLYLNVKNNYIAFIESNVPNPFPKLKDLDLSNNEFYWFNLQWWSNTLTHLNLNNNKISLISHKELSNLISYTLDNNKISSIGKDNDLDLTGLSSLEYLSISNNPIRFIHRTAFVDMVNLRCLNMSENDLSTLDPEILTPLTSLEVLALNDNMFDVIPLEVPLNITTLLMDCNRILDLTSSSLSLLPNLRKLSLAGNMISNIHVDTFKSQELLEELYLNDNELNHLPEHWDLYIESLRYLDLSGNKLTSISYFLSMTGTALEIYLDENPLKYISGNNNITIPANMTIYLNVGQERSKPICKRNAVI